MTDCYGEEIQIVRSWTDPQKLSTPQAAQENKGMFASASKHKKHI